MKTKTISKRTFLTSSAAILCGWTGLQAVAQTASSSKPLRIGIFDSRAIAIAYGNSDANQKAIAAVKADYEKAKTEKNEKRMKELEAKMQLKQRQLHEQGFSTGSVIDALDLVKADIPKVAQEAGVDLIVSKWEVMFKAPNVETVDVTKPLAMLFHPKEKALKWIESIETKAPIPMDQLPVNID